MKILLKILKERSWVGGKAGKMSGWAMRARNPGSGFPPLSLAAHVMSLEAPTASGV